MTVDFQGFPPCSGTSGEATPQQGEQWLSCWIAVGGTMTIGTDNRITPILITNSQNPPIIARGRALLAERLVAELQDTPGLLGAVRAVVSAHTGKIIRQAMRDIGANKE